MNENFPYLVEMMNKRQIKIDPEEVGRVMEAIQKGGVVKVKQGVIVGSFVSDIVLDEQRYSAFLKEKKNIEQHNRLEESNPNKEERDIREIKGLVPLQDVFEKLKKLQSG